MLSSGLVIEELKAVLDWSGKSPLRPCCFCTVRRARHLGVGDGRSSGLVRFCSLFGNMHSAVFVLMISVSCAINDEPDYPDTLAIIPNPCAIHENSRGNLKVIRSSGNIHLLELVNVIRCPIHHVLHPSTIETNLPRLIK